MSEPKVLVAVSASRGFIGWAIRKLTGSKVNHTFLLYRSAQWGGWWAAQIAAKGVVLLPAFKVTEECDFLEVYESQSTDLELVLAKMRDTIGEKYDYAGIVGFFLRIVAWKVAHKKIRNALHSKGELFCSEFVAKFLRAAGTPQARKMEPSITSPGDVREYLQTIESGFIPREWPLQIKDVSAK